MISRMLIVSLAAGLLFIDATIAQAETLNVTVQQSLRGVKHFLSCHCYNVALVRGVGENDIPVCFSGKDSPACKKLELKGQFKDHTHDPEFSSPCSRETIKIFFVDSYECRS